MVVSRDQNAGRSHNIKVDNSPFEIVEEFKYKGTTLTHQNYIQEEIKSRLKSGNAYYLSVQNLLSSIFLSKNLKIKIYKTIILPVCMCVKRGRSHWGRNVGRGCLRMGCWVEYLGLGGTRRREWRKLHDEELNDLYSSPIIVQVIKSRRMRWARHVARMGDGRGVYSVLVGKPEGSTTWETQA